MIRSCFLYFLLVLLGQGVLKAQYAIDSRGVDSVILNTKLGVVIVDTMLKEPRPPESELNVFEIDGQVKIDGSLAKKASIKKIYCRRANGKVVTLYFVLTKDRIDDLRKKYGDSHVSFDSLVGPSGKKEKQFASWSYSDYSVFYLPSYTSSEYYLIVNNDSEPSHYRDYEKMKELIKE